jgi:hypothetical protein
LRAPGFFTGTTNSLSIPPRQRSSRYAIHAGRNLPDKEFRSTLLPMLFGSLAWGPSISVGLCMSPYSSDFIINLLRHRRLSGVKSLRIPHCSARTFLLIICTPSIVTADCSASSWRFSDVPAYGQILLRQRSHLRTVIVTAAVYRGFASELRLAAVPSG